MNMFHSSTREDFWALRNVNLEVRLGETLGIVGANGSGKSTLLKLLARIIEPTTGKLTVKGRVSALLELGAGFHPDLTGKENIYLNGALLGIRRKELDRKFEEIVDFAELERFIYTPLKHYSAGMIMRLGFTISLSLDPDILLIDEILAVGDASFQRKCIDRIRQLTQRVGATILVSHDLGMVRDLCTRAIWLQGGVMAAEGPAPEVVSAYLESEVQRYQAQSGVTAAAQETLPASAADNRAGRSGTREAEITDVTMLNGAGQPCSAFEPGEPSAFRIHFRAPTQIADPVFELIIHRSDGTELTRSSSRSSGYPQIVAGEGAIDFCVKALPLLPGLYDLSVTMIDKNGARVYDQQYRRYKFQVGSGNGLDSRGPAFLAGRWEMDSGS